VSLEDYLHLFELGGEGARLEGDALRFGDAVIRITNGIPRFTPDISYSTGNFSLLRERHAHLQLDSLNGTTDRRDTLLDRTGWPADFFRGKLVLECGSGAGPDTEVMRQLGADVVSADIAGSDICMRNVGHLGRGCIIQADITALPLRPRSFDVVFCHRVLQHTPDPPQTLEHILGFVKPGGHAFVHSYARTAFQMLRWKYALRPITRRMSPEKLYRMIESAAPSLFWLTNKMFRVKGGGRLAHHFVPFLNYSGATRFAGMSQASMLEYAIHDTFDALSPRYDSPVSAALMRKTAERHLTGPFEIVEHPTITLLRSRSRPHAVE
jgi:2-polyprenyl-3-methyl-5-hydroxy-6-metoxy-1,4-benzoquinol methylase